VNITIKEVPAKTILTRSGLPGTDWVINPYNGCPFACMYCYAAQIARWKHPSDKWGSYVDVKINAPELLIQELTKLEKKSGKKNFGSLFLSSVTDPYNGVEATYQLTRKCLTVLSNFGYEGDISILTKSPLVVRDIDIFKKLKNISVGLTVTSLDDTVSRFLEVHAPPVTKRIEALSKLHKQGISTYAFVGPMLPYVVTKHDSLKNLIDSLEHAGVKEIWFEHINLSPAIKARLFYYLQKANPTLIPLFEKTTLLSYQKELDKQIYAYMKEKQMAIGGGSPIHHGKTI
jgi:DNA repair photolyase